MHHPCKNNCLTNIDNCPICAVAYEFVRFELCRLQKSTDDVLNGLVRDCLWESPLGENILSIGLFRGTETLEQLNNRIQVCFFSDRRIGLVKSEWYIDGRIDHHTWETLGIVDPSYNKFNTKHRIPITIYNNDFVDGFSYFVDSTIEWMHSEDYLLFKEDFWTPDRESSIKNKLISNTN